MIIGHLPAGYLIGRALAGCRAARHVRRAVAIGAAMAGSVFPDFDMLYFHLVDHGRTPHHLYWTHLPSFWIAAASAILFAGALSRRLQPPSAFWFFLVGVLSHLILDSVSGGIYWLLPFNHEPYSLVDVPARRSPWLPDFLLHWTFAFELLLAASAAALAYRDAARNRARPLFNRR